MRQPSAGLPERCCEKLKDLKSDVEKPFLEDLARKQAYGQPASSGLWVKGIMKSVSLVHRLSGWAWQTSATCATARASNELDSYTKMWGDDGFKARFMIHLAETRSGDLRPGLQGPGLPLPSRAWAELSLSWQLLLLRAGLF